MKKYAIIRLLSLAVFVIALMASGVFGQWKPTEGPVFPYTSKFTRFGSTLFTITRGHIYKSIDDGLYWSQLPVPFDEDLNYPRSLCIDRDVLYVCSTVDSLYRTSDFGITWENVCYLHRGANFLQVFDGVLYVSYGKSSNLERSLDLGKSWITIGSTINDIYFTPIMRDGLTFYLGSNGIFKSETGISWVETKGEGLLHFQIISIQKNNKFLYALDLYGHLLRSPDEGERFISVKPDSISGITGFDVSDSLLLITTLNAVYLSKDDGEHWQSVSKGIIKETVNTAIICGKYFFAGTDFDIYRLSIGDSIWGTAKTGFSPRGIESISVIGNTIVCSSGSYFLFRSTDGGLQWSLNNNGINEKTSLRPIAQDPASTEIVVGGHSVVFQSANNGESWDIGNMVPSPSDQILSLAFQDSLLFASSKFYIDRSTDNGKTWLDRIWKGPGGLDLLVYNNAFYSISDYGIYRSLDYSESWSVVGTLPYDSNAINNDSYRTFRSLAATTTTIFASADSAGVIRSTDNGFTWSYSGLESKRVGRLFTIGDIVFAGTYGNGIYHSLDNGSTWQDISDSLDSKIINCMAANDSILYIGTDRGVWKRPLSEISYRKVVSRNDNSFSLASSPNPFTTETTLTITSAERVPLLLEIFDLLGKKVYDGGESIVEKGESNILLNGKDLPKGALVCKLSTTGREMMTVKLIKE